MFSFLLTGAIRRADEFEPGSTATPHPGTNLKSTEFRIADEKIEALRLACAAMWSLVKEKHGATDQDLMDRILELDAADGKLDGRVSASPNCLQCGHRMLMRARAICVWCGAETKTAGPF